MKIPIEVSNISEELIKAGFEAYLVGGSVRDILLFSTPKDWDIATNAKPEEIQKIFPESIYENNFGTVAIKTDSKDESTKIIEVTTYRSEAKYSDSRHPDEVKFVSTIEEDLSRRDFTVNAIAMDYKGKIIDPFNGQKDIEDRVIRAVGIPKERFLEDALRLLRAVRFSIELDFTIDNKTERALLDNAKSLKNISSERIRDEFVKIINTPHASDGIRLLEKTGLLSFIIPELREGIDCDQNKHHTDTVFVHNVKSLDYAAKENYPLELRLAALLHDVGKPRSKYGEGENASFHSHEVIGAKMTRQILNKLTFSKKIIHKVVHLVRHHMFMYNVDEVSPAGVRRLISRIGIENIDDILELRKADRIGSGTAKAFPYKLRHLLFMIDKVKRDPISPKALKIDGSDLMKELKLEPSPRLGFLLNALLEKVLDDPKLNTKEDLLKEAKELNNLSDKKLEDIMKSSKTKQAEYEKEAEQEIKQKHKVK